MLFKKLKIIANGGDTEKIKEYGSVLNWSAISDRQERGS
jgi:hypothetical protein